MTNNVRHFVRIDRAHCRNCGDKRALRLRNTDHSLPVTLDAEIVERTPWKCECGRQVELDVEMVE